MPITFDVKVETGALKTLGRIARDPFGQARGRGTIRSVRRVAGREFARGGGFNPGGSFNAWKRTKPFGTRPAPSVPLGGLSGSLSSAWQGGPGGFAFVRGKSVVIGVTLIYAAMHRGGVDIPSGKVTIVRAKKRTANGQSSMRLLFISKFAALVSERKVREGMRIPGRPHVDLRAPQYQEAMAAGIVEAISEAVA